MSTTPQNTETHTVTPKQPTTSHQLARSLQKTAEWLLSRGAFEVEAFDVDTWLYITFHEKDAFLAAAKALGTGKKEFSGSEIQFKVTVPGGRIKISAPRDTVCRLIRPAEYECEPFLSPDEEAQIGSGQ